MTRGDSSMRVHLPNGLTFDLGLTGREHQEKFSDEKYRALAGGSPQGRALQALVDEHWVEWLKVVEDAPWLRNWNRSPLYARRHGRDAPTDCTDLPSGVEDQTLACFSQRKIARAIYAEAVWGYGMADWLRSKHARARPDARTRTNVALRTIHNLQNLTHPNPARTYTWDDKIYRGCGLLVPWEFGDLDRWLEPLWAEAQEQIAQRFDQTK